MQLILFIGHSRAIGKVNHRQYFEYFATADQGWQFPSIVAVQFCMGLRLEYRDTFFCSIYDEGNGLVPFFYYCINCSKSALQRCNDSPVGKTCRSYQQEVCDRYMRPGVYNLSRSLVLCWDL